ncbi:Uncharacterized protein T4A_5700 [Trichinella pseudospiralis]|uniref:Bridge-like lipid transfer protein family member 1 C-terminal domain-containing protein n=1 Tax=Trichinella pseudospiralis TaxID=6337 RepID=A0A0V1E705_TRIPS|nr:Uncharacterized protein T4A_5700 [Trichinella pseudospiralis]
MLIIQLTAALFHCAFAVPILSSNDSEFVLENSGFWKTTRSDDLHYIFSDIEWNVNFAVLLFSLVFTVCWICYLMFYNCRLLGCVVTKIIRKFCNSDCMEFSVGSISFSALTARIMFRDVKIYTEDYTIRVTDGLVQFRYWSWYTEPITGSDGFQFGKSYLNVLLNGFECHVYNQLRSYTSFDSFLKDCDLCKKNTASGNLNTGWSVWKKVKNIFPIIHLKILYGRLVFGNCYLPNSMIVTFDSAFGYLHFGLIEAWYKFQCVCENFNVKLEKSLEYADEYESPPRLMGGGFVVLQSAKMSFLHIQKRIIEDKRVVIEWQNDFELGKATSIRYGPWADRQRSRLYKFFFPYERIYPEKLSVQSENFKHTLKIAFLENTVLDVLFIKEDVPNAIHCSFGCGSFVEVVNPVEKDPHKTCHGVQCHFVNFEMLTSLEFRQLICAEKLDLLLNVTYPQLWTENQNWNFQFNLTNTTFWFVFRHRNFFVDLLDDWSDCEPVDLYRFFPYQVHIEFAFENLEIIFVTNLYNWIDTSSQDVENWLTLLYVCRGEVKVMFPFERFDPCTITIPLRASVGEGVVRCHVPKQSLLNSFVWLNHVDEKRCCPIFEPLQELNADHLWSRVADDKQTWFNSWTFASWTLLGEYKYHLSPVRQVHMNTEPEVFDSDSLFVDLQLHTSTKVISAELLRCLSNLKENYFGNSQQFVDICSDIGKCCFENSGSKAGVPVIQGRPLEVKVSLLLSTVRAYLSGCCVDQPSACFSCDRILFELFKADKQHRMQLLVSPIQLNVADSKASLSSLQLCGEWNFRNFIPSQSTVEVSLGDLEAVLTSVEAIRLARLFDLLIGALFDNADELRRPLYDSITFEHEHQHAGYKLSRLSIDSIRLSVIDRNVVVQLRSGSVRCDDEQGARLDRSVRTAMLESVSGSVAVRLDATLHRLYDCCCVQADRRPNLSADRVLLLDSPLDEPLLECARFDVSNLVISCRSPPAEFELIEPTTTEQCRWELCELGNFFVNRPADWFKPRARWTDANFGRSMFRPREPFFQNRPADTVSNVDEQFFDAMADPFELSASRPNGILFDSCPTLLKCPMIMLSYCELLSTYAFQENENAATVLHQSRRILTGVQELKLASTVDQGQERRSSALSDFVERHCQLDQQQRSLSSVGRLAFCTDEQVSIFWSPLALEAVHLLLNACSNSDLFDLFNFIQGIVAEVYRGCSERRHTQLLLDDVSKWSGRWKYFRSGRCSKWIVELFTPGLTIRSLQCGLLEKTTQSPSQLQHSLSLAPASLLLCTVELPKCELNWSRGEDKLQFNVYVDAFQFQLLQIVEKDANIIGIAPLACRVLFDCRWDQLPQSDRYTVCLIAEGRIQHVQVSVSHKLPADDVALKADMYQRLLESDDAVPADAGQNSDQGEYKSQVNISVGEIYINCGLSQRLELSAEYWPVYEILHSTVASWLQAACRFYSTVSKLSHNLQLAKKIAFTCLMVEALEPCRRRPVVKSHFDRLLVHGRRLAQCPTCQLMIALLRFLATEEGLQVSRSLAGYCRRLLLDQEEEQVDDDCGQSRIDQNLVALLTHWREAMSAEHAVKFDLPKERQFLVSTNPTTTNSNNNFNREDGDNSKAQSNNIDESVDSNLLFTSADHHAAEQSSLLTNSLGNRSWRFRGSAQFRDRKTLQMTRDLYNWIVQAQREEREMSYKESNQPTLNPIDLPLEVYFQVFLERMRLLRVPGCDYLSKTVLGGVGVTLSLANVNVMVTEPKEFQLASDTLKRITFASRPALSVGVIEITGSLFNREIHWRLQEKDLQLIEACQYKLLLRNCTLFSGYASLVLMNQILYVIRSLRDNDLHYNRVVNNCTCLLMSHLRENSVLNNSSATLENHCQEQQQQNGNDSTTTTTTTTTTCTATTPVWVKRAKTILSDFSKARQAFLKRCVFLHFEKPLYKVTRRIRIDGSGDVVRIELRLLLTEMMAGVDFQRLDIVHSGNVDVVDGKVGGRRNAVQFSIHRVDLHFSDTATTSSGFRTVGQMAVEQSVGSLNLASSTDVEQSITDSKMQNHLDLTIGPVSVDVPLHPGTLHGVVMRGKKTLSERMPMLFTPLVVEEVVQVKEKAPLLAPSRQFFKKASWAEFEFKIVVRGVHVDAALLPSLKATYRMGEAMSYGTTGGSAEFHVIVPSHQVVFDVKALAGSSARVVAPFVQIQLPPLNSKGSYIHAPLEPEPSRFVVRQGSYLKIDTEIGTIKHTLTTDLLYQLLFIEETFTRELSEIVQKISTERSSVSWFSWSSSRIILYSITFNLRSVCVMATTPTAIAVRMMIEQFSLHFSNRLLHRNRADTLDKVQWIAECDLHVALGQLTVGDQFDELAFQQVAYLKTGLTLQNIVSKTDSDSSNSERQNDEQQPEQTSSYQVTLRQPVLYIQPRALDKAVLLWINYKSTYQFWNEQHRCCYDDRRSGAEQSSATVFDTFSNAPPCRGAEPSASTSSSVRFGSSGFKFFTFNLDQGMHICVPCYGSSTGGVWSVEHGELALVFSLCSTQISVCSCGPLVSRGTFSGFRVFFLETLRCDPNGWLDEVKRVGDLSRLNACVVTEGTYDICSETMSGNESCSLAPLWVLNITWNIDGLEMFFNTKILHFCSVLISTLTSLAADLPDSQAPDDPLPTTDSMADLLRDGTPAGVGDRSRLIERRLAEQSQVLTELTSTGASQWQLDHERRKLQHLETVMYSELRRDLIERLKLQSQKLSTSATNKYAPAQHQQTLLPSLATSSQRPSTTITSGTVLNNTNRRHSSRRASSSSSTFSSPSCTFNSNKYNNNPDNPDICNSNKRQSLDGDLATYILGQSHTLPYIAENGTASSMAVVDSLHQSETVDFQLDLKIHVQNCRCKFRLPDNDDEDDQGSHSSPSRGSGLSSEAQKKKSSSRLKHHSVDNDGRFLAITLPGLLVQACYRSRRTLDSTIGATKSNREHQQAAELCMWISLESMPDETVLSPHALDFIEKALQVHTAKQIRNRHWQQQQQQQQQQHKHSATTTQMDPVNLANRSSTADMEQLALRAASVAVESFPIQVYLCISVQSSSIRLVSDQWSMVECVMKLPELQLVFTYGKEVPENESSNQKADLLIHSGLAIVTLTLSEFSLYVFHRYSKHVRDGGDGAESRDAFCVQVKSVSVNTSRGRKSPSAIGPGDGGTNDVIADDASPVYFSLIVNISEAKLRYDMRRLQDVLSFPRAWYRRTILRRIILGDSQQQQQQQQQQQHHQFNIVTTVASSSSGERLRPKFSRSCSDSALVIRPFGGSNVSGLSLLDGREHACSMDMFLSQFNDELSHRRGPDVEPSAGRQPMPGSSWRALLGVTAQVKNICIEAMAGQVMGHLTCKLDDALLSAKMDMNGAGEKSASASCTVERAVVDARGGFISGTLTIDRPRLFTLAVMKQSLDQNTVHQLRISMEQFQARIDWMSENVFMFNLVDVSLSLLDQWNLFGEAEPAHFAEDLSTNNALTVRYQLHWRAIELIINRSTVYNLNVIVQRLRQFFRQQFRSGRMILFEDLDEPDDETPTPASGGIKFTSNGNCWQKPLELLTRMKFLSSRWSSQLSVVKRPLRLGSVVQVRGRLFTLSCFHGGRLTESSQWALFHMRELRMDFVNSVEDKIDGNGKLCTAVDEFLQLELGDPDNDIFNTALACGAGNTFTKSAPMSQQINVKAERGKKVKTLKSTVKGLILRVQRKVNAPTQLSAVDDWLCFSCREPVSLYNLGDQSESADALLKRFTGIHGDVTASGTADKMKLTLTNSTPKVPVDVCPVTTILTSSNTGIVTSVSTIAETTTTTVTSRTTAATTTTTTSSSSKSSATAAAAAADAVATVVAGTNNSSSSLNSGSGNRSSSMNSARRDSWIIKIPGLKMNLNMRHQYTVVDDECDDIDLEISGEQQTAVCYCSLSCRFKDNLILTHELECLNFLRELLLSNMLYANVESSSTSKVSSVNAATGSSAARGGKSGSVGGQEMMHKLNADRRRYVVQQWYFRPNVELMGTTMNPDLVMTLLGINKPSETIPKWLQRYLIDSLDSAAAISKRLCNSDFSEISSDHETESDEKQDEEAEDEHYFPEDEVPYFRGLGEDSSDSFMETDTSVKVAKFTPNEDASPLYFQGLNAPKPRRKSCFRELKYKNRRVSRKPIEVQENHALNKYKRAVTLLATGRKDKACSMLRSLLKTPFLKKKKSERSSTGINNVAKSLRYAIFKNLAKVEARKGDHDSAMALYLKAFKLCSSDWTLCVEFGIEATRNLNMVLARAAFCQALSISPNDMFVLDKYISTCYILEDYIGCIESIGRALELDSNYLRGYVIRDEIFKRNKYLKLFTIEQLKNKHFEYSSEDAERILMPLNKIAERLHKPLANINAMNYVKPPCNVIIYNLSDFGNALCDVYDYLTEKREHMGKLIDWTDIWNFVLAEQFGDFDAMQREISVATNVQTPPQQVIANDEQMETGRDSGIKNAVGKRSARLIPGFRMEDPEAFGPLTTRRLTLRDKLCLLFSEELPFKDPEQTAQHRDGDGAAGAGDAGVVKNNDGDDLNIAVAELAVPCLVGTAAESLLVQLQALNGTCTVLMVLFKFLSKLSLMEHYWWSDDLRESFLHCHALWSKCWSSGKSEQEGRINLMALELKFHFRSDEMPKKQHLLGHAIGITNIADLCQDCLFAIRAYHMLARLFELNNVDAAAGFYFKRCYQLMLEEDLPEMRVASCGLTICRDELYKKSEMADLNQLLGQVEQLIEDGVIGLAVEILEKSLHTSVEHLHQQVFVRQMMLLSCYKQLGLFTKAAPLFLTLLDQLVADYRRSDVGERRAVWRPIQRLLDAGSWLFQGDAQASVFQPSFCAPVAQQLIELIVFADEYPFYKRDIPDQCWLLPWIFLYNILNWFEMAELVKNGKLSPPSTVFQRKSPPRDLRMVTNSLNVLKLAHDVLGEKSLCMINDGQLLEFFMEEILRTLRHPNLVAHPALDGLLETMNEAEQCIFCMCRYPMKRKRNLRDHSVAAADLTWNRTITLFDFIIPEKLPQCDSAPNESVSSEALQLLLRMETLVPESLHLNSCYDTEWDEYFFDDRVDPPSLTIDKLVPVVSTLYYVIADHYLKYQEFSKAVDYYLQDLLINPNRFDSLAGLAQAASGIIDARLFSANLCFTMEEEAHIYRWSRITVKAYEKALELDKTHVTFWMEFGNSAYLCHSFYRRLINRLHDRGQLSKEQKVVLKKRRNNLLDIAEKAFLIVSKNANFQSEGKDQWLVFYMLGKIGEKRNDSLEKLLALYFKSIYSLYADGVQLVESIRANNPPRGSLEMLELYYRIHVCILKNFILDRISFDRLENVCNFLALVRGSPCSAITDVVLKNNSSSSLLTANSQVYGDSGIDEILNRKVFNYENSQYICFGKSTLSGPFVSLPNPTNSKHAEAITMIMEMCRDAFVSCIQRFSGHYKSYYWLSILYFSLIPSQTSCASMEILYGAGRSGNPPLSNALFHCRRQTNLFDGICSYPVDDISRPGCFYMHMRRSVKLLIDCAITYDDLETLCEILWYLRKKPEVDRVYLLEDDRKAFLNELQRYVSDFITTRYASMSAENQRKTICMICKLYFSVIRVPGFSVSDWRQLIVGMYLTMSGKQDGDFTQALSFARSLMETREYGSATLSRHPVLKSKGRKRMKSSITNAEDGSIIYHENMRRNKF